MSNRDSGGAQQHGRTPRLQQILNAFLGLVAVAFVAQLWVYGEQELAILFGFASVWFLMILHYLDSMAAGGCHP